MLNEPEPKRADRVAGPGRPTARPAAVRRVAALSILAGLGVTLPAWALHWPWTHRAAVASSRAVSVLAVAWDDAGAARTVRKAPITQYWDRNTLLLDLTKLGGAGGATLTPVPANGGWPVRLELRVQPGTIARLQVTGAQRVSFIVPAHGAAEVLKLDPGVYLADTARISLRWSAVDDLPR